MITVLAGRLDVRNRIFSVEEVPTPRPGPGEVLVKVEAAGVCLSDVHLIDGTLTPRHLRGGTVTLGHETAGVVAEPGGGVTRWQRGRRVLLQAGEERDGAVWTRGVDYDGGWAEYAVAAESTLVEIPDDLPFEQAAIIPDAVSTPWAAITATARVEPARPAGVWGAGGLGAHAVQLLRLVGAVPVVAVDPAPGARERALAFGADAVFSPDDPELAARVREAAGGGLAAAFDFAGVPEVREQAVGCLGRGGRLVLVGLTDRPLTISDGTAFSYFQQQVLGHYGSSDEHVEQLVALVRGHRLEFSRSVGGVLPLAEAREAVDRLLRGRDNPVRLVLRP